MLYDPVSRTPTHHHCPVMMKYFFDIIVMDLKSLIDLRIINYAFSGIRFVFVVVVVVQLKLSEQMTTVPAGMPSC